MLLTTWPDVGRHQEPTSGTEMSTTETGSGNNLGADGDFDAISTAIATFSIMPDLCPALLTLNSRYFLFSFRNYFYFRFFSPPFCVPDVGRGRTLSAVTHLSRAWSKMWG
jgi:hypothetical protein